MSERLELNVRRSLLGRARGVGPGHSGVGHWRAERITSIALIPLTFWFIFAILQLVGAPYEAVVSWAGNPVNAVLMLVLVAITFQHMHQGLQVVYEDYVAVKWQMALLILATKGASLLFGLVASLAVLKLALS